MSALAASLLLAAATLDHSAWDSLLRAHVTEDHFVAYRQIQGAELEKLDAYLRDLAQPWPKDITPAEEKAALINAYNALTLRWVLRHYPVASIWKTKKPFREARHTLDGKAVSLDEIETRLRKTGDVRIHAALVCAARSCPPLRREAYTASRVNQQLDDNTRQWLANPKLNSFNTNTKRAEVSQIFQWYQADFPDLLRFLEDYAPWRERPAKITHKTYHWGLNDAAGEGASYSKAAFYLDALRNR